MIPHVWRMPASKSLSLPPNFKIPPPPRFFTRHFTGVQIRGIPVSPENGVMRTIASWFPNSDTTQPRHSTCVLSACQGCASPLDGVPCDRDIAPYVVVRKSRPGGSNLKTPRGAELVDHRFTPPFRTSKNGHTPGEQGSPLPKSVCGRPPSSFSASSR